jgi:hypothetical protein
MRDYERKFLETVRFKGDFRVRDLYENYDFLKSKGVRLRKLKAYLNKQLEEKNDNESWFGVETNAKVESIADMFYLFTRYHKAAQKLSDMKCVNYSTEKEEDLYPENIFMKYERINDEIIFMDNIAEKYSNAVLAYINFEKEFEVDGVKYYATVPRSQKELIMEGYNLHNCLVMRGPYVASGEMKVVFIRKEDNKPFMDIILNNENRIIWAITDYHENVKIRPENYAIVKAWYKSAVRNVKYDSEMWIPYCFC